MNKMTGTVKQKSFNWGYWILAMQSSYTFTGRKIQPIEIELWIRKQTIGNCYRYYNWPVCCYSGSPTYFICSRVPRHLVAAQRNLIHSKNGICRWKVCCESICVLITVLVARCPAGAANKLIEHSWPALYYVERRRLIIATWAYCHCYSMTSTETTSPATAIAS